MPEEARLRCSMNNYFAVNMITLVWMTYCRAPGLLVTGMAFSKSWGKGFKLSNLSQMYTSGTDI